MVAIFRFTLLSTHHAPKDLNGTAVNNKVPDSHTQTHTHKCGGRFGDLRVALTLLVYDQFRGAEDATRGLAATLHKSQYIRHPFLCGPSCGVLLRKSFPRLRIITSMISAELLQVLSQPLSQATTKKSSKHPGRRPPCHRRMGVARPMCLAKFIMRALYRRLWR